MSEEHCTLTFFKKYGPFPKQRKTPPQIMFSTLELLLRKEARKHKGEFFVSESWDTFSQLAEGNTCTVQYQASLKCDPYQTVALLEIIHNNNAAYGVFSWAYKGERNMLYAQVAHMLEHVDDITIHLPGQIDPSKVIRGPLDIIDGKGNTINIIDVYKERLFA